MSFKNDFAKDSKKALANEDSGAEIGNVYKPLSFVGPYLSLRLLSTLYFPGTAHPMAMASYITLDVRELKKPLTLTDFFDEIVILKALLADKVVG